MSLLKTLKTIGLFSFLLGIALFTVMPFFGDFKLSSEVVDNQLNEKQLLNIGEELKQTLVGQEFSTPWALSGAIVDIYSSKNEALKEAQLWDQVMYDSPQSFAFILVTKSTTGGATESPGFFFLITFGLAIIGGLLYLIPDMVLLGPAGIKNDGIYHNSITKKGWVAWIVFAYLVSFYIILYFYPSVVVNQIKLVDPLSRWISGNPASQWFLYGFLYCTVMLIFGIRMMIKYRHNGYQLVRTASVLFFQVAFAFLIPEILVRFNLPYMDFKNAWPLDYDFFFDWNINSLIANGKVGIFMLVWGGLLTAVIIPVMVYFYGKRWYCSWVCGCGGLAETLGDPFRQHSDKGIKAWKVERYLIHGVLVFAVVMTAFTLGSFFSGSSSFMGIETYTLQKYYGFLIGSIFSGVIGTGFYPIFGNRVWCRFGCPLAAYMGLVQRYKSRFRITTNGGQCISCGNCSTYCEQGIDVRAYAQKGQNIVRSSCVGCGICSAVCPRGVLKLENGPEEGRINDDPIQFGQGEITLKL